MTEPWRTGGRVRRLSEPVDAIVSPGVGAGPVRPSRDRSREGRLASPRQRGAPPPIGLASGRTLHGAQRTASRSRARQCRCVRGRRASACPAVWIDPPGSRVADGPSRASMFEDRHPGRIRSDRSGERLRSSRARRLADDALGRPTGASPLGCVERRGPAPGSRRSTGRGDAGAALRRRSRCRDRSTGRQARNPQAAVCAGRPKAGREHACASTHAFMKPDRRKIPAPLSSATRRLSMPSVLDITGHNVD